MALIGSLDIMPLAELFQWAGTHGKSGILEVWRGRTRVQFAFENGRLAGSGSNDPPSLLGQYLLAHGKLDEKTLHDALLRQERDGGLLGEILIEMGVLTEEELGRYARAKAEETIFKLFDWQSAEFRFDPSIQPMSKLVRLDLEVQEILRRGAQRQAESKTMRAVFSAPDKVLVRPSHPLQPEAVTAPMVRRLYELVDGKRTFAQILLLSRAPEFVAMKFLFELQRRGIVAIKDLHERPPEPGSPEAACTLASRLAARGEDDAAIEILQACQQDHPCDENLLRQLTKLETSYLEEAYRSELPPTSVPVPQRSVDDLRDARLSSNELFILEMITKNPGDVRSVVRLAPLHEIDVIRGEVREGESEAKESAAHVEAVMESLNSEIDQSLGILDGLSGGPPARRTAE
jgi:hypothetical protein